jgi:uncharacterized repeat protein (TIGR03803 family)
MAAMAVVFALTVALMQSAQAQTYHVLYSFTNGLDGESPRAGLTMDTQGNLYGTAYYGGSTTNGTAFKLTPTGGGKFNFRPLHSFGGFNDGWNPVSKVTIGPGGLYGTTNIGVGGGTGMQRAGLRYCV